MTPSAKPSPPAPTRAKAAAGRTDPPTREIELKLRVVEGDLPSLRDGRLVTGLAQKAPVTKRLNAVYFDTPDHRLAAKGLGLRIRRSGRARVQTLKMEHEQAAGAVADRREWEVAVSSDEPDLRAFDDPAIHDIVGTVLPGEFEPLFATRVRREVIMIAWPGASGSQGGESLIEMVIDEGTIEAGRRKLPVREIELELKSGEPAALFRLAEKLGSVVDLAVETRSKADRGLALATGMPPNARKAGKLALVAGQTTEEVMTLVFNQCLAHWCRNEQPAYQGLDEGGDDEGVHQIRVALRRLRSALSIFAPVLAEDVRRGWNTRFAELIRAFGPARDLDVFVLSTLPAIALVGEDRDRLDALMREAQRRRKLAYEQVRACIDSEAYRRTLFEFAIWIETRGWRHGLDIDRLIEQRAPIMTLAQAQLARRHKKVRKLGKGFARLSTPKRHEVRIALKKLRYGVDFFGSLFLDKEHERAVRAYGRDLEALQDALGHMNDLGVAEIMVDSLVRGADAPSDGMVERAMGGGIVLGWYAALARDLEPQLVGSWQAFEKNRPFWVDTNKEG